MASPLRRAGALAPVLSWLVLLLGGCGAVSSPPGAATTTGATAKGTADTGATATAPLRPQLPSAQAAAFTAEAYLAQGPAPWRPEASLALPTVPDAVVAADGSGGFRSLQAAIDAAPALRSGPQRRHVLQLRPGSYRGAVCIHAKAPLLLLGTPGDAAAVEIVDNRYNGQAKRPGTDVAQPCHPELAAPIVGTPGSASLVIASDDVQLAHLTVANDAMAAVRDGVGYPPGAGESGGAQGVALMVQADRVLLDQVRLIGHQDTLFVRHAPGAEEQPARVLVRQSLIAGDVDFIFGNGTLVVSDSTVLSRAGRRTPGNGGHVLAPSTRPAQALGMLVVGSRLLAEPGLRDGQISLGRAWDEGVPKGGYQPGVSPNGQALVRDSEIGPHIGPPDAPWSASTSRRPYAATGPQANRMLEFNNRKHRLWAGTSAVQP